MNTDILSSEIALSEELVAEYLESHPEFFNRHPQLVTTLRVSDPHRGTVSFVDRQQKQLREKIHGLEDEITQLMSIATRNEQLFSLYSDLYLRLLDSTSIEALLACLHQTITELLSLSDMKLWLVPDDSKIASEHPSIIANDCAEVMHNRLADEAFYFGRLQQCEQERLFSATDIPVGSVVLIKLEHDQQDVGFLAISSQDAEHFDPRMDTLLLEQFRKLVAKLIVKHLQ